MLPNNFSFLFIPVNALNCLYILFVLPLSFGINFLIVQLDTLKYVTYNLIYSFSILYSSVNSAIKSRHSSEGKLKLAKIGIFSRIILCIS